MPILTMKCSKSEIPLLDSQEERELDKIYSISVFNAAFECFFLDHRSHFRVLNSLLFPWWSGPCTVYKREIQMSISIPLSHCILTMEIMHPAASHSTMSSLPRRTASSHWELYLRQVPVQPSSTATVCHLSNPTSNQPLHHRFRFQSGSHI